MASNTTALVVLIMMMLIYVPTITFAKDFIVGDESGWAVDFDYQTWASTKQFRVGDRLVFQYPEVVHNVYKVNETDFESCSVPEQDQALKSGNDVIALSTPGNKWYICGVPGHCLNGQKLAITVLPISGPQLAPTAQPPALGSIPPIPRVHLPWIITTPSPAPAPYTLAAQ